MRSQRLAVPRSVKALIRPLVVAGLIAVTLFPIYWLVLTSFKPASEILSADLRALVPQRITAEHYLSVVLHTKFGRYFFNSVLVASVVTLATLGISSLGAYALARLRFPGRHVLAPVAIFAYTVPSVLLVVPLFTVLVRFNLHNSYAGLILTHVTFAVPFCLWLLRGYFRSLPIELEDAARVDGASRLQVLALVVLPLAAPGLVAAAMFAFILSWNEFLFALVLLNDDFLKTLPVGVQATFMSVNMGGTQWAQLTSASVMGSIPAFVLFVFLQKWLVQGLTAGGVKG